MSYQKLTSILKTKLYPVDHLKFKVNFDFAESFGGFCEWDLCALNERFLIFDGPADHHITREWLNSLKSIKISLNIAGKWNHYSFQSFDLVSDWRGVIPQTIELNLSNQYESTRFAADLQMAQRV